MKIEARAQRTVSAALLLTGAIFAAQAEAIGEEVDGQLTGPMDAANYVGLVLLVLAAILYVSGKRIAIIVLAVAWVAIAPLQSWRLLPGAWCQVTNGCAADYSFFQWNGPAVLALLLPLAALALQFSKSRQCPVMR